MGGGTTLVEGSRLGMQMLGNDLNPVAWFVVKQEIADVDLDEVKRLLVDIEAEVKPQIMPYYYCDGPNGEKGTWTHKPSGKVLGVDFDPLALKPDQRMDYSYEGPEIIFTFWAKHGPCQITGCGHRTPIMSDPVMAIKTISIKCWEHKCSSCGAKFDIEENVARMAPDVPLYVVPEEPFYAILTKGGHVTCPNCGKSYAAHIHPKTGLHVEGSKGQVRLGKGKNKKVELTLLVHPEWLAGSASSDKNDRPFGGSVTDDIESTIAWNLEREGKLRLLEVRGPLPETVICPETHVEFRTGKEGGTVPKKSHFTCGACGAEQDVLKSMSLFGKSGPMALYAIQGYSEKLAASGDPYGGRFFAAAKGILVRQYDHAMMEWESLKSTDLSAFWPHAELPEGFKTTYQRIPEHGYPTFESMFNARQLLGHCLLLKSIMSKSSEGYTSEAVEFVLGAFQNFLRNQNMFSFWHITLDKLAPAMSNNNYHPKANVVEVGLFSPVGYGPWKNDDQGFA